MNVELRSKFEGMVSVYENRVLVLVVMAALVISACLSLYTVKTFAGEVFNPARGDVPVITYEVAYHDKQLTQVAVWLDQNGATHYATETPKLGGAEVPLLILVLVNLGLVKAAYDTYTYLTGRYRKRLLLKFRYRLYPEQQQ